MRSCHSLAETSSPGFDYVDGLSGTAGRCQGSECLFATFKAFEVYANDRRFLVLDAVLHEIPHIKIQLIPKTCHNAETNPLILGSNKRHRH